MRILHQWKYRIDRLNMVRNILFIFLFLLKIGLFAQELSESNDFSYSIKLYNEQFYELAAQQFSRFVNKYPGSDKIDDAGYYIGMAYFKLKDFDNARIEF